MCKQHRAVQGVVLGLTALFLAASPAAAAFIELAGINGSSLTSYETSQGAIFGLGDTKGTGTGVFPAFLRIEPTGRGTLPAGFEDGFNTDGVLRNDEKPGAHTKSVLFANLGTTTVTGEIGTFLEFQLDWNEPNDGTIVNPNHRDLKILELAFYISNTGNQSKSDPENGGLGTLFYKLTSDLAAGEPSGPFEGFHVYDANAGQGQSDFQILLPTTLLTGITTEGKYLTLYAKFGAAEGTPGSAEPAFEEFSYRACPAGSTSCTPPPPQENLPEPSTYALMGAGLAALAVARKRAGR